MRSQLPSNLNDAVSAALTQRIGQDTEVVSATSVGGGSINQAAVLATTRGDFFLKWNAGTIPDLFAREAEGLQALASASTELVVPEPLTFAEPHRGVPGFLLLELLQSGRPVQGFDERLGRGLAQLHRHTAAEFGFAHDNYCGTTIQPNRRRSNWVDFYRDQRLGHLLRLACDTRAVDPQDRLSFERLLKRLDELLESSEPPALIHGDLWSGNLHVTGDGLPALIDPAAYFAHREAELGMMVLFGGFSERVFVAYDEAYPLADGWRRRLELYSLYHVMNHFVLFGGGYGARAFAIARRWS